MTAIQEAGHRAAWWPDARATLSLAWPMILTNVAQTAMTTTSVLMIGRLGPEALAASTLGFNLYFPLMLAGLGLLNAVTPMVSRAVGMKAHSVRDARRTVRQGMWLSVCAAVLLWLFLWHAESLLLSMGQQPELAADAGRYVRALQWALLPHFLFFTLRSFISAIERPGWGMLVAFVAVAFNVLACWCLIFGNLGFPALGIVGAGLATTASSTLMFLSMAAIMSMDRGFRRYAIFGRFWVADFPRMLAMLKLGMPIAALLLFEVGLFAVSALLMGLIDTVSIAAHAIAMQIISVSFMVPLGIGQATTVRVGRAFGAADAAAIARAGWTALVMGVGFMMCTGLILIMFPRTLISAFIDVNAPENQAVLVTATGFLFVAAIFQVVDGAQAVSSGMLRGIHDTTVPMMLALVGYWVIGMPLGALLAFWAGLDGLGIWIGLSTGLLIVAVAFIFRWTRRDRLITL